MKMKMDGVGKRTHEAYKRQRIFRLRLSGEDKNNQGWVTGKETHKKTLITNIIVVSNTNILN